MNTNNLGLILRERRREKELTLTQLSNLSGVSTSHVGRIERGERVPSGHILRKLAKPLGFSELELCKLAGFLSEDAVDRRMDMLKERVKEEIVEALASLCEKIDRL